MLWSSLEHFVFQCDLHTKFLFKDHPEVPSKFRTVEKMSRGSSSLQINRPSVTNELRRDLIAEAIRRKKRKLTYFNGPCGTLLRTQVPNHIRALLTKEMWCGLCNVNNSCNVGSKKTNVKCRTCGVPLCNEPHFWRSSCWVEWHSNHDLFQRVNCRPQPRRSWIYS